MKNKFTILGCGSSLGSPWITNYKGNLKNHPKNPALRKIYHLSEIMRCEMLGSKMLKGIKKNLENNYYQKINNKKYEELKNKERELSLEIEKYLKEKTALI